MSDTITPRWLLLKAAAAYSAIGKHRLIKLAQDGVIAGCQDPDSGRGDWIFDRLSIDRYREGQIANTINTDAIAILRSAGVKCRS